MLILAGALLVGYIFPLTTYFYLRSLHGEDKEYKKDCWDLLWNGWLLGFPVFGFSLLCSLLFRLTGLGQKFPMVQIFFSDFVLKAGSEELMKYILARHIINKNRARVSFFDMMAYTTISAIGFEMMESVFYMFSTNVGQILVRGVTNMHAAFGLIMGYILASGYKKKTKNPLVLGLLIPILIHGIYDLCLNETFDDTYWGVLSLLIAFICLVINIALFFFVRKHRNDPYYTEPLFPEEALKEAEAETKVEQ
ncbi:MAG: PrsW family intramembrane metalloprotease [Erysipelotrichaceae bacterium]|nr:PrsW family intramembrane metalloprotease [Erysipelotrichaceae bacterium]